MRARPRVKICGLTRFEDVELAVDLGADALGFVFWPESPRAVGPDAARAIVRALPAFVTRVGVFVNAPPREVAAVADTVGLDAVQLHGEERVEDYEEIGPRLIRVVRLGDDESVDMAGRLPPGVTPLVDAEDEQRRGGTGRTADWARAALLAGQRRIALAGGLTGDNVATALRTVRPWAVDVSSGVEVSPGVKSAERLRMFFREVAAASGVDE